MFVICLFTPLTIMPGYDKIVVTEQGVHDNIMFYKRT